MAEKGGAEEQIESHSVYKTLNLSFQIMCAQMEKIKPQKRGEKRNKVKNENQFAIIL